MITILRSVFCLSLSAVVRTNCVDCLDRTNAAQFFVGLHTMGQQLYTMGLLRKPQLEPGSELVVLLMEMYEVMGDRVSIQYGGSSAHNKGSKLMSRSSLVAKQKDLFTSVRRYYSNAFTDRAKQDAINLFLGAFVPGKVDGCSQHVWDLENDFYLHNTQVQVDPRTRPDPGWPPSRRASLDEGRTATRPPGHQVPIGQSSQSSCVVYVERAGR